MRADFLDLRFWFDRGVDGFRIDVANSLVKQPGLPDIGPAGARRPAHPHWDRDEVHEIYREWRALADAYDPPRVFVAEAWVDQPERLSRYVRPDELHTAFNFNYLVAPWRAPELRKAIDETVAEHAAVGAPPTWVLSNHDVARHVSRYARGRPPSGAQPPPPRRPADLALGIRRARAAALLILALPGGAYVYQGEELGLPEVEDLPEDVLQDPTWERSGHTDRGRDGCRVPIPWPGTARRTASAPAASRPGCRSRPTGRADRRGADRRPGRCWSSTAPRCGCAGTTRRWATAPCAGRRRPTALAFDRDPGFTCVVNCRPAGPLPAGPGLLASGPLDEDGRGAGRRRGLDSPTDRSGLDVAGGPQRGSVPRTSWPGWGSAGIEPSRPAW